MRKLATALFIALLFLSSLALFAAGPTTAQEPEPPPQGRELPPTPGAGPVAPPLSIDRALLPKIDPQLLKKLLQPDNQPASFIVHLKATANLTAAVASAGPVLGSQGQTDPLARRVAIVQALQQTAQASQAGVLQLLQSPPAGLSGQAATNVRSLWIINAVAARGNLATVLALAARPEVEVIRLDKEVKLEKMEAWERERLIAPEWNISKIRADLVHQALAIDGSGIVVSSVDSGVDWQHPALQARYRGYTGAGKLPQHSGNWFDATGEGASYPVDSTGHGTHTMGTAVGENGIGVAPGARWIAARAFDSSGSAQSSWLHAAFQWIMAPNNNPALAPDIVNNSWGSDDGSNTEFQADVQALLAASIFPVFAAGNNGPGPSSVGSPGSLSIAFSVGATDKNDEVTTFSGRGPSWWDKVKPEVTAPGKEILSALPGGAYGLNNGTSMATPHVSGLAALLMQASPVLRTNLGRLSQAITSTTVRLGSPVPNNDYGWGRVDAYNAVMAVAPVGVMQGAVTRLGTGSPIGGAVVQIANRSGPTVNTTTDISGTYRQGLAAATYDVTVTAFGYQPATVYGLVVAAGTTVTQNFSLALSPTGTVRGKITDAKAAPLAATVSVEGTPAKTTSNSSTGNYSLDLPAGVYTLTVVAAHHRVAKKAVTVEAGAIVTLNFQLGDAPAILLVDGGRWYQESQASYYQQALADLLYPFDTWQIAHPFATPSDVPTATTLSQYNIVIWSAPFDSPGYVDGDGALQSFLAGGGRLLLSGQDVAYFDEGSAFIAAGYLKNYLKVEYVADDSGVKTLTGDPGGPFAGMALTIEGGDGANNQALPDVIANADPDTAGPLLSYTNGDLGALHADLCLPYRAIFLAFGFEAIQNRADRAEVMDRAITWLTRPSAPAGLELTPMAQTLVGNFGETVSHSIRLRNTGTTADVVTFNLAPGNWPVTPATLAPLAVPSCQAQFINLAVRVDPAAAWHTQDTLILTAASSLSPTLVASVTRTTQSPAPVLLVDDSRWYNFDAEYEEALAANGIPYDYVSVPKTWAGAAPPSPPLATLRMYPMIIWYTASDWFQPLTTPEEDRLAAYLEGGGRLLFSGQDYLFGLPEHKASPFAQDYLGVQDYTESYTSTLVVGQRGNAIGNHFGPEPLTFPMGYKNWTDALTRTATAQVATAGQTGQPNGLMHGGPATLNEAWRTVFMAYGPELLPAAARARLTQRAVGWLSWLGSSTVTPSTPAALEGTLVTYTVELTNDGWTDLPTTVFTATFPAELTLESFSPELTPSGGNLIWQGPLARNGHKVFTYTAAIQEGLPLGTIVGQTSWLAYPAHHIVFDRVADVYVNFSDLTGSAMTVEPTQGLSPGDVLTYTIVLKNSGLASSPLVTTVNTLPPFLELIAMGGASQGDVITGGRTITWTAPLAHGESATLTYRAVISYQVDWVIDNTALADDGISDPVVLQARARFKVNPMYLPIIFKGSKK